MWKMQIQARKIRRKNAFKMENIGQIIGFAAMVVSILIYLQRRRKNILILKLTTDVLWTLHHLLIFSYTAAVTTSIAIFRELVFYNYEKKWAKSKWWSVAFSLAFVLAAVFTWKDIFSIIPAVGTILTTVAFGSKNMTVTRIFASIASLGMLIYGLHYNSIPTVINECLTQLSVAVSFIVGFHIRRKGERFDKQ